MSDTKVTFLKKPMSIKVFWIMTVTAFITGVLYAAFNFWDLDIYFIIPTGKYILGNGFPHENVFTIDGSSGFVAQQWLYAVVLAKLSEWSIRLVYLFLVAQLFCLYFVMYKFCKLRKLSAVQSFLCILIVTIMGLPYLFKARPQVITLILLIAECICLEKYKKSHNALHLAVLLPIMLVEANVHISMWPMHYAVIFAYAIPAFYYKRVNQTHLTNSIKHLSIASIAMLGMVFCNPYGLDGVTYVFRSLMSTTFDYIEINEVARPEIISAPGLFILIIAACIFILHKLKSLTSVTLNFCLGLGVLMATANRHIMFLPIMTMFIFFDFCNYVNDGEVEINWKKDITRMWYLILTPIILYMCVNVVMIFSSSNFDKMSVVPTLDPITTYLAENNVPKDAHIFTTVNSGGYLEYLGYNNIYMDARPELYSEAFTKDRDIAKEFYTYAHSGEHVDLDFKSKNITHDYNVRAVTNDEMQDWLNSYDFDYLIVDEATEYLSGYLAASDRYEVCAYGTKSAFILYHKLPY
jgi:hypothetical protein